MDRDDVRRASRRKAFGSLLVAGGVMIAEILAVLIVVFLNLPEGSIRSSLIPELAVLGLGTAGVVGGTVFYRRRKNTAEPDVPTKHNK